MNKIIVAAALLASTSLSAAASDVCATIRYDFKVDLNVRSGPGIAYPVVRELHPGDTVPMLKGDIRVPSTDGTFTLWQSIMYEGGGIGWVNASYIQPTHCPVAQLPQSVPVASSLPRRAEGAPAAIDKRPFNEPDESQLQTHTHYTNRSGEIVHSPSETRTGTIPEGATAQCGDGSYSFSHNHRGTCSRHNGVVQWFR